MRNYYMDLANEVYNVGIMEIDKNRLFFSFGVCW